MVRMSRTPLLKVEGRVVRQKAGLLIVATLAAATVLLLALVVRFPSRVELIGQVRGARLGGGVSNADEDPFSADRFGAIGSVAEGTILRGLKDELRGGVAEMGKENTRGMPTLTEIRRVRRAVRAEKLRENGRHVVAGKTMTDCGGSDVQDCLLALDSGVLEKYLTSAKRVSRGGAQELLQTSTIGGGGSSALEAKISNLKRENEEQIELQKLLRQNAMLRQQNSKLERARGGMLRAVAPVDESTQGNPPGVLEAVPATVTDPPLGPADFNGDTGIVAKLPMGGYAPSLLSTQGVEKRGSFVARKANPYAGIIYRIYGKMNHPISCTLKGYRKLDGNFAGNTVYTGYHVTWRGKSSVTSGYVPSGGYGEFDLISCEDEKTGEVQHFRDIPTAPDSSFDHEYPYA